ncbi:MAG: Gx transporter family protein [Clostridia bacterium]|nr:Gx transporter family protein [Clostridia bacterium]
MNGRKRKPERKKPMTGREKTVRLTLCGLLTAIMLILGFVESLIPFSFGVPGIKLGLSNSVLIFAVYMLDIPAAFLLMTVKVTLSAMMFGAGLFSMPMWFALAGGTVSTALMALLSRDRDLVPTVVSMAGGVGHNVGQVIVCMLTVTGVNMMFYMGILMLVGMLTGGLTGLIAERVLRHMKVIRRSVR